MVLSQSKQKLIGEGLIEAGLITSEQRERALVYQRKSPEKKLLGRLVVELGFVKEEDFAPFLAIHFGLPFLSLRGFGRVSHQAVELVPEEIARRFNLFPVCKEKQVLTVAMADPLDVIALDNLRMITSCQIQPVVSSQSDINQTIRDYYQVEILRGPQLQELLDEEMESSLIRQDPGRIKQIANSPFAAAFLDLLLERALKHRARAIHIQPNQKDMEIFFRLEQDLERIASYPKRIFISIMARMKALADLELDQVELPQTGNFSRRLSGSKFEFGVSTLPTIYGERAVLEVYQWSILRENNQN